MHAKKTLFLLSVFFQILHAQQGHENNLLRVSFDTGMEPIGRYLKDYVKTNPFWKLVKQLYTNNIVNKLDYKQTARIPKIIHQIWLGSPIPQKYEAWRDSWIKNHPDWIYILWTDKEVEKLDLINKKMYDKASNYGEKSDIARVEILYRMGGLYVDTDFECLKPFDVLHHCCNFYAGIDDGPTTVFNGLMASAPKHPILLSYIENMKRDEHETDSTGEIAHRTGPQYFTKILHETLPLHNNLVVLFPTTFFYPWPWFHRFDNNQAQIQRWIRPETMAIHHWEASWNGGKYRTSIIFAA